MLAAILEDFRKSLRREILPHVREYIGLLMTDPVQWGDQAGEMLSGARGIAESQIAQPLAMLTKLEDPAFLAGMVKAGLLPRVDAEVKYLADREEERRVRALAQAELDAETQALLLPGEDLWGLGRRTGIHAEGLPPNWNWRTFVPGARAEARRKSEAERLEQEAADKARQEAADHLAQMEAAEALRVRRLAIAELREQEIADYRQFRQSPNETIEQWRGRLYRTPPTLDPSFDHRAWLASHPEAAQAPTAQAA